MSVLSLLQVVDYLLQLFLLVLLWRGFFRSYAILSLYCIVQLAITTVEEVVFHYLGSGSALYSHLYWTDEVIVDLLLFLMVIRFTFRALESSPLKPKAGRALGGIVIVAVLLPFLLYFRRGIFTPFWFNGTAQMLSFGAAIMNLALWTALAGNRKRDARLLTLSAGLGLAVTGAAVYYGLRVFMRHGGIGEELLGFFKSASHVTSVLIWCWAFLPKAKEGRVSRGVTASPQP